MPSIQQFKQLEIGGEGATGQAAEGKVHAWTGGQQLISLVDPRLLYCWDSLLVPALTAGSFFNACWLVSSIGLYFFPFTFMWPSRIPGKVRGAVGRKGGSS